MTALVVALAVAVALLGLLVAGLLRSHAEVVRALHHMGVDLSPNGPGGLQRSVETAVAFPSGGPDIRPTPGRPLAGDVADLVGTTPRGETVNLAVTGVRHDTLVAFLTSGCATCRGFWETFRAGPPDVPGGARLVTVTRGSEAESPGAVGSLAGDIPVVMSTAAWEHYDVPYAPYFVYISGPAGRVMGEGVAAGWDEVRSLVANAVADGTTRLPAPPPPVDGESFGRPRSRADRERDAAVDRQLAAAGIRPGDPRLHPPAVHSPDGLEPAPEAG